MKLFHTKDLYKPIGFLFLIIFISILSTKQVKCSENNPIEHQPEISDWTIILTDSSKWYDVNVSANWDSSSGNVTFIFEINDSSLNNTGMLVDRLMFWAAPYTAPYTQRVYGMYASNHTPIGEWDNITQVGHDREESFEGSATWLSGKYVFIIEIPANFTYYYVTYTNATQTAYMVDAYDHYPAANFHLFMPYWNSIEFLEQGPPPLEVWSDFSEEPLENNSLYYLYNCMYCYFTINGSNIIVESTSSIIQTNYIEEADLYFVIVNFTQNDTITVYSSNFFGKKILNFTIEIIIEEEIIILPEPGPEPKGPEELIEMILINISIITIITIITLPLIFFLSKYLKRKKSPGLSPLELI